MHVTTSVEFHFKNVINIWIHYREQADTVSMAPSLKMKTSNVSAKLQNFSWMFKHSDGEVSWVLNLNLFGLFRQWFTLDLEYWVWQMLVQTPMEASFSFVLSRCIFWALSIIMFVCGDFEQNLNTNYCFLDALLLVMFVSVHVRGYRCHSDNFTVSLNCLCLYCEEWTTYLRPLRIH